MSQKNQSNLTCESAKARLEKLRAQLGDCTLMAVSKYSKISDVELYYELGQFDFGENRVDELQAKAQHFAAKNLNRVRWHFIGNLQRNKVKKLLEVPSLVAVHSIARTELLDEFIKHSDLYQGECLELYLEVNLGGEEQKHGFSDGREVSEVISRYQSLLPVNMKIKGLMAMAPIRTDQPHIEARGCFSELAHIAQELETKFGEKFALSMGMSSDYKIALECGSHIVRIGSFLFK